MSLIPIGKSMIFGLNLSVLWSLNQFHIKVYGWVRVIDVGRELSELGNSEWVVLEIVGGGIRTLAECNAVKCNTMHNKSFLGNNAKKLYSVLYLQFNVQQGHLRYVPRICEWMHQPRDDHNYTNLGHCTLNERRSLQLAIDVVLYTHAFSNLQHNTNLYYIEWFPDAVSQCEKGVIGLATMLFEPLSLIHHALTIAWLYKWLPKFML